jgi:predicted kinase
MASDGADAWTPRPGGLILVCGLPGGGKTSMALTLASDRRGMRLNADEWMAALAINLWDETARERVEVLQRGLAQELLHAGAVVIVEWGTSVRAERDVLREMARSVGARAELVFLDVPMDELWRRIQERGIENPPVQWSDLEQWASMVDQPNDVERALFDGPEAIRSAP